MAKDILSHPTMTDIVSANKNLVNFFTKSHFWSDFLEEWRKENKIGHGLMTACETRWYSMAKVCISVSEHEGGFKKAIEADDDPSFDSPKINSNVRSIISDRDHFTANQALITVLKSVVDAIGRLEHANTTLADIWKEVLHVYCALSKIDVYSRYLPFKRYSESVLHLRSKVFNEDIYFIAFFLNPLFRTTAVSRRFDLRKMNWMICNLANRWGFSARDGYTIKDEVIRFYNSQSPFQSETNSMYFLDTSIPSTT
jgi:hypothetical protein